MILPSKLNSIGLVIWLFCISGCGDGFTQLDSGLAYKVLKKGSDKSPANGEYLVLNMEMKKDNDSVIYNSSKQEINLPVRYDAYALKSGLVSKLHEGLFMLKEGDSMVFKVTAERLFESSLSRALEKGINAEEVIYCYVGLADILTYDDYISWQKEVSAEKQAQVAEEKNQLFEKQITEIENFLRNNNIDFQTSPMGVRYVIDEPGSGPLPQDGDSLLFKYDVTYFDGSPVEHVGSSVGEVKTFVLGTNGVFESWQESIRTLRKGGSGKYYIPSTLSFGASGQLGIKPNAILVVSMELVDII